MSFLAGLCTGGAVLCDYMAFFVVLPLAAYALTARISKVAKCFFGVAGGICAVGLAVYDRLCFGSALTLSYARLDSTSHLQDRYHGFAFVSGPDPMVVSLLLGLRIERAHFRFPPSCSSRFLDWSIMARKSALRKEAKVIIAAILLTFAFLTCHLGWHGGTTFGPRYLVALLPFLAVPLAQCANDSPLFLTLLGLSVFQFGCAQLGYPHIDPRIQNPVIEIMLPLMIKGVVSMNWLGRAKLTNYLVGGLVQYGVIASFGFLALRGLTGVERPSLKWYWLAFGRCWAAYVVLMLLLFRTLSPNTVRWYRALALHETATMLHSIPLEYKAREELSGSPSGAAIRTPVRDSEIGLQWYGL